MNIESLPSESFLRGSIVSIIDKERLVIETFTDGKDTLTIAFWNGLPIPMDLLLFYISVRMAPSVIGKYMPSKVEKGRVKLGDETTQMLTNVWGRIDMRPDMRADVTSKSVTDVIHNTINFLFGLHTKIGEEEEVKKSFIAFIQRLDEDYTSSLVDPSFVV